MSGVLDFFRASFSCATPPDISLSSSAEFVVYARKAGLGGGDLVIRPSYDRRWNESRLLLENPGDLQLRFSPQSRALSGLAVDFEWQKNPKREKDHLKIVIALLTNDTTLRPQLGILFRDRQATIEVVTYGENGEAKTTTHPIEPGRPVRLMVGWLPDLDMLCAIGTNTDRTRWSIKIDVMRKKH